MSRARETDIASAFERAERESTCLVPTDRRLAEALRRKKGAGSVVSPRKGLFARRAYWDGLSPAQKEIHLLKGLAQLHPNWTFCSVSAALLYGFDVPYDALGAVHVNALRGEDIRSDKLVRSHATRESKSYLKRGVRLCSVQEALFGCMRDAPFDCAVAIVDSALRKGASKDDLSRYLDVCCRGRKGVVRARLVLAFADGRSESGGESRARVVMARLGFAAPDLQVSIADPFDETKTYRSDYLWRLPDGRLIMGELDGEEKYQDPGMLEGKTPLTVLTNERRRESRLTLYRIPIMRFSFADVQDPQRLEELMVRFGIPRDEEQRTRVL